MSDNAWILVQNDGEMDIRLLELMGASTKDGESTIGCFGTGWKYGIALAMRKGISVQIFSGRKKISFSTRREEIEGSSFDRIMFSVGRAAPTRTSLTTGMGQKDWTDEWYLLREVMSNAFDAKGFTMRRASDSDLEGEKGKTKVFLSMTQRFEEILQDVKKFVRRHDEICANRVGKVFAPSGEKCRIFKRGIFVKELEYPGVFDYDLHEVRLSESRTADSWDINWEIRRVLTEATLDVRKTALAELRKAQQDKRHLAESWMTFSTYSCEDDKAAWEEAFNSEFGGDAVLCPESDVVKESLTNLGHTPVTLPEKVAEVLRGSKVKTEKKVLGTGASEGYVYRDFTEFERKVMEASLRDLRNVIGTTLDELDIRLFRNTGPQASTITKFFVEETGKCLLVMNESVLGGGVRSVINAVYSEILRSVTSHSGIGESVRGKMLTAFLEILLPKLGVII